MVKTKPIQAAKSRAPLLTVAQCAQELSLTPAAIRAWLRRRELEFVRVGKRAIRIPFDEVARIIAEGTVPARPQR